MATRNSTDSTLENILQLLSKQFDLQDKRFQLQLDAQAEQLKNLSLEMASRSNHTTTTCSFSAFNPTNETWNDYLARFTTFSDANFIANDRVPLIFLTSQVREIFHMIHTAASQMSTPKDVNSLTWDEIKSIMSTNFDSKKFVVRERYRFYTEVKRDPNESPLKLAAKIRKMASKCDFHSIKDPLDEALRTCFVCTINNEAVLKAIFHKSADELTFAQVVDIACQVEEASKTALAQLRPSFGECNKVEGNDLKKTTSKSVCFSCGEKGHLRSDCKFREAICRNCGIQGHIQKACWKQYNRHKMSHQKYSSVNTIQRMHKVHCQLVLMDQTIDCELDTGSMDNFISSSNWRLLGQPLLTNCTSLYKSAEGSIIPTMGCFTCDATIRGQLSQNIQRLKFIVSKVPDLNLIGIQSICDLGISIDALIHKSVNTVTNASSLDSNLKARCMILSKDFPDLWKEELGCLKEYEIHLKFISDHRLRFYKPRPIPFAIQQEVNDAISIGIKKGGWKPVAFNEYGTPIVPIIKAGGKILRICGDYRATKKSLS